MNSFNGFANSIRNIYYVIRNYVYNFPAVDASLVFYYPLDSTDGNARTANYASGLPVYDASMMGLATNTYTQNSFVTGLGDLILNNIMGSGATAYVRTDTSFNLVPSTGLSISFWVSCSGQLGKTGTLISLNSFVIDISDMNYIRSWYTPPPISIDISEFKNTDSEGIICAVTDNKDIIIATPKGVFYKRTNQSQFTKSNYTVITPGLPALISMNNSGFALLSIFYSYSANSKKTELYKSTDYGVTWAIIQTITNYYPRIAIVTDTGKCYCVYAKNSTLVLNVYSFMSSDTNTITLIGNQLAANEFSISFSELGGFICYSYIYSTTHIYYISNGTYSTFTKPNNISGSIIGIAISNNGKYVVCTTSTALYYATIQNEIIGTFTGYTIDSLLGTIGVGICYISNNGKFVYIRIYKGGSIDYIFNILTNTLYINNDYNIQNTGVIGFVLSNGNNVGVAVENRTRLVCIDIPV